jgi:NAD+ synthase
MTAAPCASADLLRIDVERETARITESIRDMVLRRLKRRGAVVGISGGIDSTVVAYLCARALGAGRTIGLCMPEMNSSSESLRLGRLVAESLGVRYEVEDISSMLKGARCYERQDAAIREVFPEYTDEYKYKIALPDLVESERYSVFSLVVQSPAGKVCRIRLTLSAYLGLVAATNFKQRTRKMMEYYYADLYNYAVAGTPNKLEYDLGFFVKNGDGAADFKPIAHLYKSQVYELARYLGVPEEILCRTPTTDTYTLEQTQEEFFFAMPLHKMDICIYGLDHDIPPADLAPHAALESEQVARVYRLIESRRKAAAYLHAPALMLQPAGSQ